MKSILLITVLFLFSQNHFVQAQTQAYKINEYDDVGIGCDEFFRMTDFVEQINKRDGNKGLIVLHVGDGSERYGNILGHISGTKKFFNSWLKLSSEKFSFVVTGGKSFFTKELWIIPDGAQPPEFAAYAFDWDNLQDKYFFSTACLMCEPSYGLLTTAQPDYEDYSKILKSNSNYRGLITVNSYSDLFQIRKILTKNFKLPRSKFSIGFEKKIKGEEENLSVNLYIIPSKTKNS